MKPTERVRGRKRTAKMKPHTRETRVVNRQQHGACTVEQKITRAQPSSARNACPQKTNDLKCIITQATTNVNKTNRWDNTAAIFHHAQQDVTSHTAACVPRQRKRGVSTHISATIPARRTAGITQAPAHAGNNRIPPPHRGRGRPTPAT